MKYHLNNWLTQHLNLLDRFQELTDDNEVKLYDEIRNATLQGLEHKIRDKWEESYKGPNLYYYGCLN
jgi:hypothetical protein